MPLYELSDGDAGTENPENPAIADQDRAEHRRRQSANSAKSSSPSERKVVQRLQSCSVTLAGMNASTVGGLLTHISPVTLYPALHVPVQLSDAGLAFQSMK